MEKHYAILYCDPPWDYDRKVGSGIARDHYQTMNIRELYELPVGEIADKDSILFLWVTFPMLKEALALIERWGFRYKTCAFNWVKRNKKADSCLSFHTGRLDAYVIKKKSEKKCASAFYGLPV